jgi:murein DD-endopeptidase MepM/ murein hydrolase activator NlpD
MGLLNPTPQTGTPADLQSSARELEALFLKQFLQSSGAFKGSGATGSDVNEDLFAGALADAVSKAGGIGLADTLARSLGAVPDGAPAQAALPLVAPAANPVAGGVVTSAFGTRADPIDGHTAEHQGVDIAAPEGTAIRALSGGVVRSAGPRGGLGNAVEVDHGGGVSTIYGHASELLVRPGDHVGAGQPLARVGHTGRATGPHLHLEVRQGHLPVDPGRVLKLYGARDDGG